jgi:uncharacterized protein (TIGR04141 family)
MARPKTREGTLYRLPGVAPNSDAMFDALIETMTANKLDEIGTDVIPIVIAGSPALWTGAQFQHSMSEWCPAASVTTGLDLAYGDMNSAGLIMIAVDGVTYALGYGAGHRLIRDELKDQRFGLRFAVRRVDPGEIRDLVRRRLGAQGRTDSTLIPGGLPVWSLGVTEYAEIIRCLGGLVRELDVTFSSHDDRPVKVEGSVGLRMRFGVSPEDLVADIREIARVCAEENPHPALEFVEHIQPVADPRTKRDLETRMDALLGGDGADGELSAVVPSVALADFAVARAFTVSIGSTSSRPVPFLGVEDFLRRTRLQHPGRRAPSLREGQVTMYADEACSDRLCGTSAAKWLEASASLGPRRFFLLDGEWYEIGAQYAANARTEIADLFMATPSLDLPPWRLDRGHKERDYNLSVPVLRDGYVCLDRDGVRNPLGAGSSLEICDLLGPDDELIGVKHASGSAPLSHLFSQMLVSTQSLLMSADVRAEFAARVAAVGRGHTVPEDFTPKKVVFGILLKDGQELTPDSLFPFSQVTLAHTARILRSHRIDVEVIGISAQR